MSETANSCLDFLWLTIWCHQWKYSAVNILYLVRDVFQNQRQFQFLKFNCQIEKVLSLGGRKQNPIFEWKTEKSIFHSITFCRLFANRKKNERKKFFFDNIFLKKIERKIYHRVCEKESVCKWVCVVRVCVWKEWEIYTLIIKVFWPCVDNKPPYPLETKGDFLAFNKMVSKLFFAKGLIWWSSLPAKGLRSRVTVWSF